MVPRGYDGFDIPELRVQRQHRAQSDGSLSKASRDVIRELPAFAISRQMALKCGRASAVFVTQCNGGVLSGTLRRGDMI